MAAANPRKWPQNKAVCALCPYALLVPSKLDCGHTVCGPCITQWQWIASGKTLCPLCKMAAQGQESKPGRKRINFTEAVLPLKDQKRMEAEGRRAVCWIHKEPLDLFCKDDQVPVCETCSMSREHRKHNVVTKKLAGQEYTDCGRRSREMPSEGEREDMVVYRWIGGDESKDQPVCSTARELSSKTN
ncbi:zinc finger protein RFP-like isoform X2 [Rhineura floridana]|uniref:zinc finger protein RFP-like isoform X2 n=1 Tax=Rhineura floridana TaxID=261503 RepID=UPI002AC81089|nr:zinc finger protein RFP-like isoform X2 [Rhineura floridana]